LVGVAVKVTEVPAQIVVAEAEMLTLTGKFGFTVMVMAFEVAGLPVAQLALEVSTQVTTSPLASAALVYVLLFVPTGVAPTYHW
jgi:hypothetical protein